MAAKVELKPKKEFINPHFDSYKLSLDPLPIYHQDLEKALDITTLTQDQLTLHHTKLFGGPNHLIPDPWADKTVYAIDTSWNVLKISFFESGKIDCGCCVFSIPNASACHSICGRLNVTLCFAGRQHAVLADGCGQLFLLCTGDRSHQFAEWKVLFSGSVLDDSSLFSVVDATFFSDGGSVDEVAGMKSNDVVECLITSVQIADKGAKHSNHLTVLTWLTLTTDIEHKWSVTRVRCLEGPRPFEYASIERGGKAVTIASVRPFNMTADSVKEITPPESTDDSFWDVVAKGSGYPLYTWNQTAEDVTVQLTLPVGISKADIYVTLKSDYMDIGVKNAFGLLKGPLHRRIDVATITWTVEGQRLEVSFSKEQEGMWDTVIVGDNRGEMTMDEATITAIHERLQHLTSDKWNPNPNLQNQPFNTQQLEACDLCDEECIYLTRIEGETHQISHQATVSHSILFCVQVDPDQTPALCLRHDVDGFLWQPETVDCAVSSPWHHIGSLDAFGYVQASKTQRCFSTCAPDLSLAAIADCTRHVYLYRQRAPTVTPLRNRRTGQNVNCVAKQHVVSLEPPDAIVGLHVNNNLVFVATASRIYVVKVNQEEA